MNFISKSKLFQRNNLFRLRFTQFSAVGTMRPNALRFDHSAEEIVSLAESSIENFTNSLDHLIKFDGPRTFENTIAPLAKFEYNSSKIGANLYFYQHMSTSKDLREASLTASKKFDDFGIGLWMRHDFFTAIKKYKEEAEESK